MLIRTIKVKNSFVGYHRYVDAPEDVKFLKDWHRHNFIVTTSISVDHNNRDIEFFELQQIVEKFVKDTYSSDKTKDTAGYVRGITIESCEQLAEDVCRYLSDLFESKRDISVEVSEDGECSWVVELR